MTQGIILEKDTEVVVSMADMDIHGIVVGKASNNIAESYIIKCIDGQLPNDVYKYDTFIAQLIYINK